MRTALSVITAATLLTAVVIDVVAAGAKTVGARNYLYYAIPSNSIAVAMPSNMKSFPTELLPQ